MLPSQRLPISSWNIAMPSDSRVYLFSRFRLLFASGEVFDGDTSLNIAGTNISELLKILAENGGQPVTKKAIIDRLWRNEPEEFDKDKKNRLHSLLNEARSKLGDTDPFSILESTGRSQLSLPGHFEVPPPSPPEVGAPDPPPALPPVHVTSVVSRIRKVS